MTIGELNTLYNENNLLELFKIVSLPRKKKLKHVAYKEISISGYNLKFSLFKLERCYMSFCMYFYNKGKYEYSQTLKVLITIDVKRLKDDPLIF